MSNPRYFWSGSNRAGEIQALAKHDQHVGIAVNSLDRRGRALAVLLSLGQLSSKNVRIEISVTRNRNHQPILMFNRERAAQAELPEGDVPVLVKGRRLLMGFRKCAVNVARSETAGINLLGRMLQRIFGRMAGFRGRGHRVALELTAKGWMLTDARLEELRAEGPSGSLVFVDSGAFGEVRFDPSVGRMVTVDPITHEEWVRRLHTYRRIAKALGERCYLVAPDKVGDQAETLRRLERYRDEVRDLRDLGANIIVPIQRGEMTGAEFDRECARVLGFSDYVRGIPSKKAAATVEEIGELSRALPRDARIHLLGLGPFGSRYHRVIEAIGRAPELVTCDSVRIKALVGRSNGPGGGPRPLTRLADRVRSALGLSGRLSSKQAETVKREALDMYLAEYLPAQ